MWVLSYSGICSKPTESPRWLGHGSVDRDPAIVTRADMPVQRASPFCCQRRFHYGPDCGIAGTRHERRRSLVTCQRRVRAVFNRSPDRPEHQPPREE
jgi:hypothetical protein